MVFVVGLSNMDARSAPVMFQSSETQTSLLELYTSEGCSSCPPAEAWLSRLKASPGLWKDFVPIAFHVDYWDYLGWRDPWASKEFSDRQRAYAEFWRSDSVYTPGLVLNGKEWRTWATYKNGPASTSDRPGVITVKSSDAIHWDVSFSPTKLFNQGYALHAALMASGLRSDVKAGENRGRRLEHDFIVLTLASVTLTNHNGSFGGQFEIAAKDSANAHLALAAWVTQTGRRDPLQATGGWIESHNSVSR